MSKHVVTPPVCVMDSVPCVCVCTHAHCVVLYAYMCTCTDAFICIHLFPHSLDKFGMSSVGVCGTILICGTIDIEHVAVLSTGLLQVENNNH